MVHKLPYGMRTGHRMLGSILSRNSVEQLLQIGPMPSLAGISAVHLIEDSIDLTHIYGYIKKRKPCESVWQTYTARPAVLASQKMNSKNFVGIQKDSHGAIVR